MPIQKSPYFLPSITALVLIIAIGATALVMSQSKKESESKNSSSSSMSQSSYFNFDKVTDFKSCVAKTGIVLESFPAQCNYNGKTYIQEITNASSSSVTAKTQTYTNPTFPDFKLVYPNDWKFTTETSDSRDYPGLLDRNIYLSKNGTTLKLKLQPNSGISCILGVIMTEKIKFDNGIYKEKLYTSDTKPNILSYGTGRYCVPAQLTSSISNKDSSEYSQEFSEDADVKYMIFFNSYQETKEGVDGEALSWDNPIVPEIDQIISQSTFK